MVSPSTRLALRKRALGTADWLEARADRICGTKHSSGKLSRLPSVRQSGLEQVEQNPY